MKPIKEVKCNNLRRLFYHYDQQAPISYKTLASILSERNDMLGRFLAGKDEIPDDKIIRWCQAVGWPYSEFYDEHPCVPWPPEKKSYRMMSENDRLVLAAEEYIAYHAGDRKADKLIAFMRLVREEVVELVSKEDIAARPVLRLLVERF